MILTSMAIARASLLTLSLLTGLLEGACAQSDPAPVAGKTSELMVQTTPERSEMGLSWSELSPAQKTALAPLAATWSTLLSAHKSKWIALVQKYPEMADADKERLHSRMVDWAALSPKDREVARLNFAETKKLPTDSRLANWEAYQALPDSKKQALLDAAPKKPMGAAVAIKPVQANKLAEVPVTRKTPEPVRAAVNQRTTLDRYTLLPQNPNTKDSVQAPEPSTK